MADFTISVDGVPIRLTDERWVHIVENHDDLAGHYDDVLETVENPDMLLPGHRGSLLAVRSYGRRRYLVVIYRQIKTDDGFVITAFFADSIDRERAIWKRQ
jgi:hypothetical protein